MMNDNIKNRIDELINIIKKANEEYYLEDNPSLSDQEYDRYIGELISLEDRYPEYQRKDSPTVNVGAKVQDKFNKVTHNIPMLSLGNVFNSDEVLLFDEKIIGSIHFTPGRAYDEAFNGNISSIHWDMVLIQREEFGGGEIYFDDVLIMCLLYFLYTEGVQDQELFICLILLLLS